jgi:hypothetical protein
MKKKKTDLGWMAGNREEYELPSEFAESEFNADLDTEVL